MPALSINDYNLLDCEDAVWVWKGIIPVGGSMLFYGSPKVGKSILALGLCEAIADPGISNYLDLPVQQHGRILFVQLDTPRSLWRTGYLSMVKSPAARENIFIIDREMADLPKQFDIRIPECHQWLRSEVDKVQPIVVVVDTIRRMHRGNENESDTVANVLDAFIWATKPAALMFIAHKKKPQQGDTGSGTARGSSAMSGAVDALVNMSKDTLYIEARSDVAEEIAIMQLDNGQFVLDSGQDEKIDFINSLDPAMNKGKVTAAIMEHFKVTAQTARRYKKLSEKSV